MGKSCFTIQEKEYLSECLSSFDAISVREHDLVAALSNLNKGRKLECVVDPTLLLSRDDWNEIVAERIIKEEYLFCYFLGADDRLREIANQYAKNHRLKIVTIPFANETFNGVDFIFANYRLFDAGPQEFISLIKHASCVFTDSFHATVFSLFYQRKFFAFERSASKGMSSRFVDKTVRLRDSLSILKKKKRNLFHSYSITSRVIKRPRLLLPLFYKRKVIVLCRFK